MILGALLDRVYDVLGDLRANPREYARADLLAHANQGAIVMRSLAKDVWTRAELPVVAGQGQYTKPADMLEIRRVAFDDLTLEPMQTTTLQSRDSLWQTTTGPVPRVWTSLGFADDKFWLWPIPSTSTSETYTWNQEYGVTVRYQEPSGANYTFTADPAGPGGWNPEYGLTVTLSNVTFTQNFGELFSVAVPSGNRLTLWGTLRPATMISDDQEVPIRKPWQLGILWYILWQVYEAEGRQHNQVLASYYRDQFADVVERCRHRAASPVPARLLKLRGDREQELGPAEQRDGYVLVGGLPVQLGYPI